MHPENNQYFPPPNYLDQIAPKSVKQPNVIQKRPIVFAVALLIVALLMFSLISALTPDKTKTSQQLAARLVATEQVTEDAAEKIKNNKLRAINSNLKLNLLNMIKNIDVPLAEQKLSVEKLNKKISESESNTDMLAVLENARLNAVYDQTYAREMAYKLSTILSLMKSVDKDTDSKSMKDFISDAYKNLEAIQQQFAQFDSSTN